MWNCHRSQLNCRAGQRVKHLSWTQRDGQDKVRLLKVTLVWLFRFPVISKAFAFQRNQQNKTPTIHPSPELKGFHLCCLKATNRNHLCQPAPNKRQAPEVKCKKTHKTKSAWGKRGKWCKTTRNKSTNRLASLSWDGEWGSWLGKWLAGHQLEEMWQRQLLPNVNVF